MLVPIKPRQISLLVNMFASDPNMLRKEWSRNDNSVTKSLNVYVCKQNIDQCITFNPDTPQAFNFLWQKKWTAKHTCNDWIQQKLWRPSVSSICSRDMNSVVRFKPPLSTVPMNLWFHWSNHKKVKPVNINLSRFLTLYFRAHIHKTYLVKS